MHHEAGYQPTPEEIQNAEDSLSELQRVMTDVRFRALTDPELQGKKIVYIMRGVPGSGKSTIAKEIAENFDGTIHSTDNFFINQTGTYEFDPTKVREAHEANIEAFSASLENNQPVIIVDNTNIKRWEFERYIELAKSAGYSVQEVNAPTPTLEEALERNLHDVPEEVIKRMLENFEA